MAMGASAGVRPQVGEDDVIDMSDAAPVAATSGAPMPRLHAASQAEALSALGNLGYAPGEAASAVAQAAADNPEADTSVLIRAALKALAPKA